jgi:predicted protein tyrosine phosphatase
MAVSGGSSHSRKTVPTPAEALQWGDAVLAPRTTTINSLSSSASPELQEAMVLGLTPPKDKAYVVFAGEMDLSGVY